MLQSNVGEGGVRDPYVLRKVIAAVKVGKGNCTRYILHAETEDGRLLTAFVKKEEWEKYK